MAERDTPAMRTVVTADIGEDGMVRARARLEPVTRDGGQAMCPFTR